MAVASFLAVLSCTLLAPVVGAASPLEVDLTYGIFRGYTNPTAGLNIWKGIRYAAAPIGPLRWQAPRQPPANRTVVAANDFGPTCPQSYLTIPNAPFNLGDEDCLYLNVYAPSNATNLPVLVWIHGGGYGLGDGTQDMSDIILANNKNFIGVSIQYRLGAFGFLSSQDVVSKGVANAGILDQAFALEWVQSHISKFGGNSSHVTISGNSAGGGSALLHVIAKQGTLGTKYFTNAIPSSPYLLPMYRANGSLPTQAYNEFVKKAGCETATSKFDCLVSADTTILQSASNEVSTHVAYANWAFLPVIEDVYVQTNPVVQLYSKKLNGLRALIGNNADEGPPFVPQNITTEAALITFIRVTFPNLNQADIDSLLAAYPNNSTAKPSDPRFATSGTDSANANSVSQVGTGQQQRANNLYAESAFDCPSYFFADAFSGGGKVAYKYQYSITHASHGNDVAAVFGPPTDNQSPDFVKAFRSIWGNFVTKDNPSIPNEIANGVSTNSTASNPASNFLPWIQGASPIQLNLNVTGGTAYHKNESGVQITQYRQPGLKNDFKLVDAGLWEGGRGARCRVWQKLAEKIYT